YVDIDAHHGDGVQAAFYDTDQVLTVSLHQYGIMPDVRRPFFPGAGTADERGRGKGAGYSVNVALPAYTDGAAYVRAFDAVVPPLLERYRPDVLVTQQGIDSHFDDPLTNLMVSTQAREHVVRRLATTRVPWVAMGGGGYSRDAVRRAGLQRDVRRRPVPWRDAPSTRHRDAPSARHRAYRGRDLSCAALVRRRSRRDRGDADLCLAPRLERGPSVRAARRSPSAVPA